MDEILPIMHRLPGKPGAQIAPITLDDPDATNDIVQELVAGTEERRRDAGAEILQADPARDDDRSRQDEFEDLEALVLLPDIVVQEGLALNRNDSSQRAR